MNDFRAASGLASWQAPEDVNGTGLYEVNGHDPEKRFITNIRRIAGTSRAPGTVLIGCGGWLLAALAAGLFYVSFTGQYAYIFAARHHPAESAIEAGMFDAGMVILSLLALGLARAGKPARTERALIVACAIGSAAMNYSAADTASPRSVIAYTAAPVFLALVVDRVIAVIRRHVRLDGETSPWAACGRATLTAARLAGVLALYLLRFILAAPSTATGVRRAVLQSTPLPQDTSLLPASTPAPPEPEPPAKSGAARFLQLWQDNPDRPVKDLAAEAGITHGAARMAKSKYLKKLSGGTK